MQLNSLPVLDRSHKPVRYSQVGIVLHTHICQFHKRPLQIHHQPRIRLYDLVRGDIVSALQNPHGYALIQDHRSFDPDKEEHQRIPGSLHLSRM